MVGAAGLTAVTVNACGIFAAKSAGAAEYAGGGGLLAAGGEWCVAALNSSLNKCNPELSPSGCGGEHKPGAFDNMFNRLNVKINPCVDSTCNIGITGICFSSNVSW